MSKRHFKLAVITSLIHGNMLVEDNVDPDLYHSEVEKGMASVAAPQAQASSTSTSTSSTGEPVLDTLMQQLAPEARLTYWQALARFLRFETSKAEFEESVAAALGDKRALHNAFIYALLRGALAAPGSGGGHLSQLAATPSGDPPAPLPRHVEHAVPPSEPCSTLLTRPSPLTTSASLVPLAPCLAGLTVVGPGPLDTLGRRLRCS